jgi:hypothetical protein
MVIAGAATGIICAGIIIGAAIMGIIGAAIIGAEGTMIPAGGAQLWRQWWPQR